MKELYEAHPAMFKANPVGFIISIGLILVFGVGILILVIWYLRTKATKLTISEDEILYEFGLLSKERTDLDLKKIKSVKVKQSFMNRIMGVGNIEIYTTGDSPEFTVSSMPEPDTIRNLIKNNK